MVAAFMARDADAYGTLLAADAETVHHPTGTTWNRQGALARFRAGLRGEDVTLANEPLATLGDALALCRASWSASEASDGKFDVGAYEHETIVLNEVDAQGQRRREEFFAADRLGDAIARLYERYADLLPDGPARTRAAATARSVATLLGPPDRWAFAPSIEWADPRTVGLGSVHGAEAVVRGIRALLELTEDFAVRFDDILGLRSDTLLVRWTNFGTVRAGGGAFERQLLELWVFGPDGLLTRWEQRDVERDAEALARFDALTEPQPARPAASMRRVRANAATANAAGVDAAFATRDADAIGALFADDAETVHHPTGATYDRQGALARVRSGFRAKDATLAHEPLATLGDAFALCRMSWSGSGASGGGFDVGAFEGEQIALIEADAHGQRHRGEYFAVDHLGDAVVRLYERYAALLPDGPARTRAAATARSVAAALGPVDLDRYAAAYASAVEFVDHRPLGFPPTRGAEAWLRRVATLLESSDDTTVRTDDVLGVRSDALLVHLTNLGTDRASGGVYERPFFLLWVFGADGLAARNEMFASNRDDEALARFDELTTAPSQTVTKRERRVRANAATANVVRFDAAMAAQDADALSTLVADEYETVEHTLGVTYDRQGMLFSLRSLWSAEAPASRHELLATLGDSLALCRWSRSASGFAGDTFDVGPFEGEQIALIEVDAQGRRRRTEMFAADRLGDAIARLYERYAELLPAGPARTRAAVTARYFAAATGPIDLDRYAAALAPAIEAVDHRILGTWSARGAEALLEGIRSVFAVAIDPANRDDEVLRLQPDACLVRGTHYGTDRASGGAYEQQFLALYIFGRDGLLTRLELFDADRDAAALARFDELTAAPSQTVTKRECRVRANAATAYAGRVDAAFAARDSEALAALIADASELLDHTSGTTMDRQASLLSFRALLSARDPTYRQEPLATLGDSLALCRWSRSGSGLVGGAWDVGAFEMQEILLIEVDAHGRHLRGQSFAPDRLGDAVARLYERYAELLPDGPARTRAVATARALAAVMESVDLDCWVTAYAPTVEFEDHRALVTLPSARGVTELRQRLQSWFEMVDDAVELIDAVLDLRSDGLLARRLARGRDRRSGGSFENEVLVLWLFGADGLVARIEMFDADRDAAALARFDELTRAAPPAPFENAATLSCQRRCEAWALRDWQRFAALHATGARVIDRRKMLQLELDVAQWFESVRQYFEMTTSSPAFEVLATRGNRLALSRDYWQGATEDVGPSEIEFLSVVEVDEHGDVLVHVALDPDDLDAAYAELDDRYAAGEAAAYPHGLVRDRGQTIATWDLDAMAAHFDPDHVVYDHRRFGWETTHGVAGYVEILKSMLELAPDARFRVDHATISARATFMVGAWIGTREGGAFEAPRIAVNERDQASGRWCRLDLYDPGQLAEARARFAELGPDPLRIPPNAATRGGDRHREVLQARDMEAFSLLCAPTMIFDDRRRGVLLTGDRDLFIASNRITAGARVSRTLLATAGDRLMLEHLLWSGGAVGQDWETENLSIHEVDAEGRTIAVIAFDPDDRRAASAELRERYARSDEVQWIPAALFEFARAVNDHDLARLRAALPDDFVFDDHRRTGLGRLESAEDYLAAAVALFEQSSDVIIEDLYFIARERHGSLGVAHRFGTLAEGGTFESVFVQLTVYRGSRFVGVELFEPEDLDLARARFEALRPDVTRIPPNAASRARDRMREASAACDWPALRALVSDDFRFDERRKQSLLTGGVDLWIESMKQIRWAGAGYEWELVATFGERIALDRLALAGETPGGIRWEADVLRLTEVDAAGRIRASVSFDDDDRRAAFLEAHARFAAGEAAAAGGQAPIVALSHAFDRAFAQDDWTHVRECLADEFMYNDGRTLGLGMLSRDEWIEALRALYALAPDIFVESFRILTWDRHGRVDVQRGYGTMPSGGGPFENVFIRVIVTDGDRIRYSELFDVGAVDQALSRFEELCAAVR
jgi:hypothetical protein